MCSLKMVACPHLVLRTHDAYQVCLPKFLDGPRDMVAFVGRDTGHRHRSARMHGAIYDWSTIQVLVPTV